MGCPLAAVEAVLRLLAASRRVPKGLLALAALLALLALLALRTLEVLGELQDLGPLVAMVPLTAVPDTAAVAAVEAADEAGAQMETAPGVAPASVALYPPDVAPPEPLPS